MVYYFLQSGSPRGTKRNNLSAIAYYIPMSRRDYRFVAEEKNIAPAGVTLLELCNNMFFHKLLLSRGESHKKVLLLVTVFLPSKL
jgi:hypothetical protein